MTPPEYMEVPHGALLWAPSGKPRTVRCEPCGAPLRPGAKVAVRELGDGRWEHVACPGAARVPVGEDGLAGLLAMSLEGRGA